MSQICKKFSTIFKWNKLVNFSVPIYVNLHRNILAGLRVVLSRSIKTCHDPSGLRMTHSFNFAKFPQTQVM